MRLRGDDRGVTLTELLVAVSIMAIIVGPLGNALITYMRNSDSVTRRFNETHDVQIATAYFAQDVQSLGVRQWDEDDGDIHALDRSVYLNIRNDEGDFRCGPGSARSLFRIVWDDPEGSGDAPDVDRVNYSLVPIGTTGRSELRRTFCDGNSTAVVPVVSLAHNVTGTPVVKCFKTNGLEVNCATDNPPDIPTSMTLTFSVLDPEAPTGSTALQVTLTGQRRQT